MSGIDPNAPSIGMHAPEGNVFTIRATTGPYISAYWRRGVLSHIVDHAEIFISAVRMRYWMRSSACNDTELIIMSLPGRYKMRDIAAKKLVSRMKRLMLLVAPTALIIIASNNISSSHQISRHHLLLLSGYFRYLQARYHKCSSAKASADARWFVHFYRCAKLFPWMAQHFHCRIFIFHVVQRIYHASA